MLKNNTQPDFNYSVDLEETTQDISYLEVFVETLNDRNKYLFIHKILRDEKPSDEKRFNFIPDPIYSKTQSYSDIFQNQEWLNALANAWNVGQAIQYVMDEDKLSNLKTVNCKLSDYLRLKKNLPKTSKVFPNGQRRFAGIYTNDEETYRNIRIFSSIPNHYMTRFYNRLGELLTKNYIALKLVQNYEREN
jgi:hypothetical protein